jgi:Uma2 family endonuclease
MATALFKSRRDRGGSSRPPGRNCACARAQSAGNTAEETVRKLGEYFGAGVRLVWLVEPANRTVIVHTSLACAVVRTEAETLDGGDVLPGLTIPLRSLFGELDRERNR